jgi:hypothetical protein
MIASVLLAAALAAQPANAPPPKAPVQKSHEKKADKNAAPDADLIGFLGDYEDAADGLDPIGLSEQMNDDKNAAADNKKKDGHGP